MKTRSISIIFKFHKVENGVILVGTKEPVNGLVDVSKIEQRFDTSMPSRRFAQTEYGSSIKVLDDEQLDEFYRENIDVYSSRSEVEKMFTFFLERGQYGHIWLTQEPDTEGTTSDMVQRNVFIVAQMVRFGFINKIKLRK